MEEIFKRVELENIGISVNGEKLNKLRFAGVIVLFAESESDLRKLLNMLNKEWKKDAMRLR